MFSAITTSICASCCVAVLFSVLANMKTVCLQCVWLLALYAVYGGDKCTSPLHLSPMIDAGDITTARKLSEVRDPRSVIPKSYSGFITTDRTAKNYLFFWFFPSANVTRAPLMVWLNGGPMMSSMFGLLCENGPIRITTTRDRVDTVERRPNSWADPFSMLYIDNPVGTGFSYSETNSSRTTQDEYGQELYVFIEQFYLMFPEYLTRELYIGGESYAGKYVPAFAHRLHTRIRQGQSLIPLTGIYLGGPYFDPLIQNAEHCDVYFSVGVLSAAMLNKCKENLAAFSAMVKSGQIKNMGLREILIIFSETIYRMRSNNFVTSEGLCYDEIEFLMNTQTMKELLSVCPLTFSVFNITKYEEFKFDLFVSVKNLMADIMDHYKVLIYTGDYDGIVSSPMVEAALMTTPWSRQEEYNKSGRSAWTVAGKLRGFYTKTGNFCRVVVHEAGHNTPTDQPESTLDMMLQFVRRGCIYDIS